MKNGANKPTYITKGDVLDDLGLSRSEASALKVKATLLDAILREIEPGDTYFWLADDPRIDPIGIVSSYGDASSIAIYSLQATSGA